MYIEELTDARMKYVEDTYAGYNENIIQEFVYDKGRVDYHISSKRELNDDLRLHLLTRSMHAFNFREYDLSVSENTMRKRLNFLTNNKAILIYVYTEINEGKGRWIVEAEFNGGDNVLKEVLCLLITAVMTDNMKAYLVRCANDKDFPDRQKLQDELNGIHIKY